MSEPQDTRQTRESRLHALRQALIEGERSGEPEPFDFEEFLARKRAQVEGDTET